MITAIVLAAGKSSRFGEENKLLIDWNGIPLIRYVVGEALKSNLDEVFVVTGFECEFVERAISGLGVRTVRNESHEEGMASSIRIGVSACKRDSAFLIVLGDMPWISASEIEKIKQASMGQEAPFIIVPKHGVRWGNPVLFGPAFREELRSLRGDRGARAVIEANMKCVTFVDIDERPLEDVDSR